MRRFLFTLCALVACSGEESTGSKVGAGGASSLDGGGLRAASGGRSGGLGGAASGSSGGAPSSGGGAATGGNAAGGTSAGGAAGSGGAVASGGSAGSDATGGASGSGGTPEPPPACGAAPASGDVYYVATDGNDSTGTGAEQAPWATIGHAVQNVPDAATVLVKAGEYVGRIRLDAVFQQGIIVRSEVPYAARLRNDASVITAYYGEGITVEGFDIAHSGPGAGALVIQVQNLRDDGGVTSRYTFRDNVLHDSYDNDILKINNGADSITVERNIFYNQAGSDEHIDINSVTNVTVRHNVFFNDFEGSGRTNGNDTSSYIVIKDSNGSDDANVGSRNVLVAGNVFLNWQGSTGSNFVLVGEDGTPNFEADGVIIESNLFLGNSSNTLRAAFGVKGSRAVTFRNNTVVGDLPSLAFAMRLNREGSNQPNEAIVMANNVWSDPTGTMEDFSDTPPDDTASFSLASNAYYNGGAAIPTDAGELVNVADDASALVGDPGLADPSAVDLPRWDPNAGAFADGSATVCQVHEALVRAYAIGNAALIDAADPDTAAPTDILGRPRSTPDIGAWEAMATAASSE